MSTARKTLLQVQYSGHRVVRGRDTDNTLAVCQSIYQISTLTKAYHPSNESHRHRHIMACNLGLSTPGTLYRLKRAL